MQRRHFLDRIRSALGNPHPDRCRAASQLPAANQLPGNADPAVILGNRDPHPEKLLQQLKNAAAELNIHLSLHDGPESAGRAMAAMIAQKIPPPCNRRQVALWQHPLVARLELSQRLAGAQIACRVTGDAADRQRFYRDLETAVVGVTSADFCLADTATLVMRSRPGQPRSVSLLPDIHAAVIESGQLLPDFNRLCRLLSFDAAEKEIGLTHCMTLISGPSKTADIEAVMVEGAHGPRELHLYVIT